MLNQISVAVGVVYNPQSSQVLIAKRPADKHQGDLWEFPGGKIEEGEDPVVALKRELHEEVGIQISHARPMIQIQHDYDSKSVLLDVYQIDQFSGEPYGKENQPVQWVDIDCLDEYEFPAANKSILSAIKLPKKILITGFFDYFDDFCEKLNAALTKDIRFVQIRAPWLALDDYLELCRKTLRKYKNHNVTFIANCDPENFAATGCHGLHLSSNRLQQTGTRPIASDLWLSAACHSDEDIQKAQNIDADFVYLSPVKSTDTHVEYEGIGWTQFAQWVAGAKVPVFALGGMRDADIEQVIHHGGQGIAAIGAYWHG